MIEAQKRTYKKKYPTISHGSGKLHHRGDRVGKKGKPGIARIGILELKQYLFLRNVSQNEMAARTGMSKTAIRGALGKQRGRNLKMPIDMFLKLVKNTEPPETWHKMRERIDAEPEDLVTIIFSIIQGQ